MARKQVTRTTLHVCERAVQVAAHTVRVVPYLALKCGYSIYDTLPQQSGLLGTAGAVIVAVFSKYFPIRSPKVGLKRSV